MLLASANSRPENVRVHPIIVSELKLRNAQRHIFGADLVKAADDAALENRPETLNRVCVNRAHSTVCGGDRPIGDCTQSVRCRRGFHQWRAG